MNKTPRIYVKKENEFEVKDITVPQDVNLQLQNQYVLKDVTIPKEANLQLESQYILKDHTVPKDIKITLPIGLSTLDHSKLKNRNLSNQHEISAITNLQETLDSKVNIDDLSIIYCGTSTEVI